jgi:hypothetical protein
MSEETDSPHGKIYKVALKSGAGEFDNDLFASDVGGIPVRGRLVTTDDKGTRFTYYVVTPGELLPEIPGKILTKYPAVCSISPL